MFFLDKNVPKNRNFQFRLKFATSTNLNMQNSMALFTVSNLDRKHPFLANLVQKIKLVSLSWNMVPSLILIRRIQWHCSLFLLQTGNTFWANLFQKIKIVSLSWNLVPRLIRRCRNYCSVHFSFLDGKHPFWVNLVQKNKIVSQIWKLVLRLIRT